MNFIKLGRIYLLVFLLGILNCSSEVDPIKFLKDFKAADRKGKVKLVANANFCELKGLYPQIKDTLDVIRRKIFTNSSSKEAKFLFDKIDVSKYMCEKQYSKAAILLESSLASHVRDIDDSIYCYKRLKESFINLNNLSKAIEANTIYDRLAMRTKDEKYINSITKKSKIYDVFGLNQQAIYERRKEFLEELPLKKHDTDFIASYFNDVGVYFNRIKRSDSAIPYFVKASELITKKLTYTNKKVHYQFFKGLIEGNMALAYTNNGEYKNAIPYLKTDMYYSKKESDFESAFNSCILLSRCYIKLDQMHFAQQYADSAQKLSEIFTQPRVKLKLLYLQGELMDALGNSSQAVIKFKAYMSLKDSLNTNEKELQLINQQVALDIQKKDSELSEMNERIQIAEINEGNQKVFRAYLMAGLITTLILIVILFYTNSKSKKREEELQIKGQQIQIQNKQIEASLNEKELLLREIHHRVKNNLQIINSVINLQSDKIKNVELNDVLSELKGRISSIALTHQMLYQKGTSSNVTLCDYLQNLITQIYQSYESEDVQVNFTCTNKEFNINIDTAIPLGLLVNEIMTNAFKHAFKKTKKGIIDINANVSLNHVSLIIKDNGDGLPDNYSDIKNRPQSLGFELIAILVQQINAKLNIDNTNGTTLSLSFDA